jgi:hypothetical protein
LSFLQSPAPPHHYPEATSLIIFTPCNRRRGFSITSLSYKAPLLLIITLKPLL